MDSDDVGLIEQAGAARRNAVADVSGYAVGAALLAADGTVFLGCNVENIVLGETCCAEKVALVKALSEGVRAFEAVAVFTSSSPPATPCGSCRQLMWQWGVRRVLSGHLDGEHLEWTMAELLPGAFKI